jgi:16S rRNA (guanine966-N2)-methyltransferase
VSNLRITGGRFRGRAIAVPPGVRPTGSRVREALFSIWLDRLPGARFLDLFAGAGSVGIEARGRGAQAVVFVESSRAVARRLAGTCRRLGVDGYRVVTGALPAALESVGVVSGQPYDLVFADPPYGFAHWQALFDALSPRLAAQAAVAVEHGARDAPPQGGGGLEVVEARAYGESVLSFLRPEG